VRADLSLADRRNLAGYGQSYLTAWSGQRMIATLRADVRSCEPHGAGGFRPLAPGEFMSRFSNDLG